MKCREQKCCCLEIECNRGTELVSVSSEVSCVNLGGERKGSNVAQLLGVAEAHGEVLVEGRLLEG
jgi:hypothetical protein